MNGWSMIINDWKLWSHWSCCCCTENENCKDGNTQIVFFCCSNLQMQIISIINIDVVVIVCMGFSHQNNVVYEWKIILYIQIQQKQKQIFFFVSSIEINIIYCVFQTKVFCFCFVFVLLTEFKQKDYFCKGKSIEIFIKLLLFPMFCLVLFSPFSPES